jgi:hypothetical protein
MFLKADSDIYGNIERFTADDFRHILDLIDAYRKAPYNICEIRRDDVRDEHGRIDIEIEFIDEYNHWVRQKLLIMNGELIDGVTFHERRNEWYK